MPVDPRHEVLCELVRIGPKTAPNRFHQGPARLGFRHEPAAYPLE